MTTTTDLRHELLELTAERDALRAQLDGDLPAATSATPSEIRHHQTIVNGLKPRNRGRGADCALRRQRLEQFAHVIFDPVAGRFTVQLRLADIVPNALRGRAVPSDHAAKRTAVGDIFGVRNIIGVSKTDDAFVTVSDREGVIP